MGSLGDTFWDTLAPLGGLGAVWGPFWVTLAARATLCGKTVSVDDFVKHNGRVLRIAACALENGNLLVVCEVYVGIAPVWAHSGTYRSTGAKEVLRVRDIDEVSAWYFEPGCVVVVD